MSRDTLKPSPSLAARSAARRPFSKNELILAFAIVIVLIGSGLADSNHTYWTSPKDSVIDIARQTAFLGIFALGAAVVIISGGIDLSSGSMIAFSGTICAAIMVLIAPDEMRNAKPVGIPVMTVAIMATLLVGFLVGTLHTWLITVVGLPPFIATLATLVGLRSLSRAICESVTFTMWGAKSTQIQIYDEAFRYLARSVWIPVLIFIVLGIVMWILLSCTVIGRHIYAMGGNEQAAELSGIRTSSVKWLAYSIGTLTSTIAGILYIADQSVATPQTLGRGYELNAIAAAVVGGCSLQGGAGTIPGVFLGALFLRCVIDGVSKIIKTGADIYEGQIVGIVVVLAVAFSQIRQGVRGGKRAFSGMLGVATAVTLVLLLALLGALTVNRTTGVIAGVLTLVVIGGSYLLNRNSARPRTS